MKPGDVFLNACRNRATPYTPIWIMRQAGRYLPEYRELRARHDFLALAKTPELACEVTLQPVRRLGVDAAILFSDILIPIEPMGVGLRFDPGPILDRAIDTEEAIRSLRPIEAEDSCRFVMDAIRMLRRELGDTAALIGFAGAPFTLAAYLVEGKLGAKAADARKLQPGATPGATTGVTAGASSSEGKGSTSFDKVVRLCFERPDLAHQLLELLTDVTVSYLSAQIRAGAQAVQIFDSWAGILGPREFREFALAYVRRIIERLPTDRGPVIYFVLNGGHVLADLGTSGAEVCGIDWRTSLDLARSVVGPEVALQGNLDPRVLFAPPEVIAERAREVVRAGAGSVGGGVGGGHIFNLGHGILPDTPVEAAQHLVRTVHEANRS